MQTYLKLLGVDELEGVAFDGMKGGVWGVSRVWSGRSRGWGVRFTGVRSLLPLDLALLHRLQKSTVINCESRVGTQEPQVMSHKL